MSHTRGVYLAMLWALSLSACSNPEQPEVTVSSSTFALAPCGDGVVDEGEQCDDGNEAPGDGCDAFCQINPFPIDESGVYPRAGINEGEMDSFILSLAINSEVEIFTSDGMGGCPSDTFMRVFSGDVQIASNDDSGVGLCSQVNLNLNAGDYRIQIDGFNGRSVLAYVLSVTIGGMVCGDGVVSATEDCDDGNVQPGDGCDELCQREPLCGDSIFDDGEFCDDGNIVDGDGCDSQCQLEGTPPGAGDLVITEIMINPEAVDDQVGEWFEIHNPTANEYQLHGLKIISIISQSTVVGSLVIPANGYLVLGRNADLMVNGGVEVDYVYENLDFSNLSDNLLLLNLDGDRIDSLVYGRGWPIGNGAAMALAGVSDASANDIQARWCVENAVLPSGDFGTPGAANSPCDACGDGVVNGTEECDDGNILGGDGCENDCQLTPVCGDGVIDEGEECDDGNVALGDGCTPECTSEIRVLNGAGEYLSNGFGLGSVDVYILELDTLTNVLLETSDGGMGVQATLYSLCLMMQEYGSPEMMMGEEVYALESRPV